MAEAQYQPEPDLFVEPENIPPATPGPVASKFDSSTAVGIDLPSYQMVKVISKEIFLK